LILRLETFARDSGGVDRRDLTLNRNTTDEDNPGRSGWQSVRLDLALPPDVYRFRAEVEDPATGRRGVVEQRVAVPGRDVFRISTPVLSDTLTPTTEAGSPAPAPVAHRSFSASGGRSLLYSFAILGAARDPSTDRSDVRIRFAVKDRSGRTLIQAPDTVVAPSPDGRLAQVIGLPLVQMPPGEYELELMVHDRVADDILKQEERFVVEAAPPPAATAPVIPGATLAEIERYAILRTLEEVGGSTSRAAEMLGISRRTLINRLDEYGIARPRKRDE
jgi:hypothetical protein